jgi:hypothetical protein
MEETIENQENIIEEVVSNEPPQVDNPISEVEDNSDELEQSDVNAESITNVTSTGDDNLVVGTHHGAINLNLGDKKDNKFACENCSTILDGSIPGKITCPNCGKIDYIPNPVKTSSFKTLNAEEDKQYKKIIAHINNKIIDGKYELAYRYCLQAEDLAPGEPTTWEYMARCEFYKDPLNTITQEAVNIIKVLQKCEYHGMEDTKIEGLSIQIANDLFYAVKKKIKAIKCDVNGSWSKPILLAHVKFIKGYDACYRLYNDTKFLEEAVRELSQPYKWLVTDSVGNIIVKPACGTYPADKRWKYFITKIKEKNPTYLPPKIAVERVGEIVWEDEE